MSGNKIIRLGGLFLAAALGGITAVYRARLAEDADTVFRGGLTYSPGYLLYVIIGCAALLLVLALLSYTGQRGKYRAPGKAYAAAVALSALLIIASAVKLFLEAADLTVIVVIQLIFLFVCAVTMLLRLKSGEKNPISGVFSLFPVYYLCLFLLLFYRENAKNPSVVSFAFEILCVFALLLAIYTLASMKFERPKERSQVFFCLLSTFFVSMELFSAYFESALVFQVPGMSAGTLIMLGGMGLYAAAGIFTTPVSFFAVSAAPADNIAVPPDEVIYSDLKADLLISALPADYDPENDLLVSSGEQSGAVPPDDTSPGSDPGGDDKN